jgi:hypothetical protein
MIDYSPYLLPLGVASIDLDYTRRRRSCHADAAAMAPTRALPKTTINTQAGVFISMRAMRADRACDPKRHASLPWHFPS